MIMRMTIDEFKKNLQKPGVKKVMDMLGYTEAEVLDMFKDWKIDISDDGTVTAEHEERHECPTDRFAITTTQDPVKLENMRNLVNETYIPPKCSVTTVYPKMSLDEFKEMIDVIDSAENQVDKLYHQFGIDLWSSPQANFYNKYNYVIHNLWVKIFGEQKTELIEHYIYNLEPEERDFDALWRIINK